MYASFTFMVITYLCLGINSRRAGKWFKYRQAKWRQNLGRSITVSYSKSLASAWNKWRHWCSIASNADPPVIVNIYQPTLNIYCAFLDFLLEFYKPETVKSYLKRINTFAVQETGEPIHGHLNKLLIKRTYAAAAKRISEPTCKRLPLTIEILKKLRPFVDFESNNGRAIWAISCVGIFALARIGELVPGSSSKLKVTLGSADVRSSKGAIHLIGTKTDRENKGSTLFFFRNNTECCPVTAMQAYLTQAGLTEPLRPLFLLTAEAKGLLNIG